MLDRLKLWWGLPKTSGLFWWGAFCLTLDAGTVAIVIATILYFVA